MRHLSDETLAARAQNGNTLALEVICARFDAEATAVAIPYFMQGADRQDIQQEARIGIVKAIHSFKPDLGVPFFQVMRLCVERQVQTAVKTADRGKHRSLTDSARVAVSDSGEIVSVVDLLPSMLSRDPLEILIDRERLHALLIGISRLSKKERQAILGLANGAGYGELSAATGMHFKGIDNAVQRGRKKLRDAA